MHATPHSKAIKHNSPTINPLKATPDKAGPCPPSNANNKCPATIFAARRTAKVPGRIIILTVSITTITGIKPPGVPSGTR